MKNIKWLLSIMAITIFSLFILAMLPWQAAYTLKDKYGVEVFEQHPLRKLTNHNIVEVMSDVQLSSKLGKVEWQNAMLLLELRVDPVESRPEAWFHDVDELIELSFVQLANVKRVLIRLIETKQSGGRLMAAIDVRSSDKWLADEIAYLKYSDPVHEEIWRQRLRLSFTSAWEKHFGPITGYTSHPRQIP